MHVFRVYHFWFLGNTCVYFAGGGKFGLGSTVSMVHLVAMLIFFISIYGWLLVILN